MKTMKFLLGMLIILSFTSCDKDEDLTKTNQEEDKIILDNIMELAGTWSWVSTEIRKDMHGKDWIDTVFTECLDKIPQVLRSVYIGHDFIFGRFPKDHSHYNTHLYIQRIDRCDNNRIYGDNYNVYRIKNNRIETNSYNSFEILDYNKNILIIQRLDQGNYNHPRRFEILTLKREN